MKHIRIFFIGMMCILQHLHAQEAINYQAVIRNVSNELLADQEIRFEFGILLGGTQVYVERHTVFTDQNGQLFLQIGNGTPVLGDFSSIAWGTAYMEILIRCDIDADDMYDIITTEALQSVPFAHYAQKATVAVTSEDNQWTGDGSAIVTGAKVGLGGDMPQTQLEVNGALALVQDPAVTVISTDNFSLEPGNRSYMQVQSDVITASERTIVLEDGLTAGQILVLEGMMPEGNVCELMDDALSNAQLASPCYLQNTDTITLIWNGTLWVELFRSMNN